MLSRLEFLLAVPGLAWLGKLVRRDEPFTAVVGQVTLKCCVTCGGEGWKGYVVVGDTNYPTIRVSMDSLEDGTIVWVSPPLPCPDCRAKGLCPRCLAPCPDLALGFAMCDACSQAELEETLREFFPGKPYYEVEYTAEGMERIMRARERPGVLRGITE